MPNLDMTIPHKLTEAEAVKRIRGLIQEIRRDYGDRVSDVHEQWTGNTGTFSFKAMGFPISGTMNVTSHDIHLQGDLPFAATLFKGQIEKTIRDRATQLLA